MNSKIKLLVLSNTQKLGLQSPYFSNSMVRPFYKELTAQFELQMVYDIELLRTDLTIFQPDLIMIDPGPAIEQSELPDPSVLRALKIPVVIYSSLDAHYHNHSRIIKFINEASIEAIFPHDFYHEFYPEDLKDKHVFIPNSYNHELFKNLNSSKDIMCGFYGAGFFGQQRYPWRREIASRVLPEFPSYVLPRPFGQRDHGVVGSSFANIINRTQFCFGCTSIKDIPVKKMFEIPACGSC